jgi:homocysteine S-methyltransferase
VASQNPIARALSQRPYLILDGALATELERRGADLNDPLWSSKVLLEQPELIRQVHYDYFVAGADVATTASYQAHAAGFARRGISAERVPQLLAQTVQLAQAARDDYLQQAPPSTPRPLVAASVGPYGAALADGSEYRGNYALTDQQLEAFHRPRVAALLAAGPDLLACETLPSLREALVLARLLREFPHGCAWISFSCQDGSRSCEGQDVAECARSLDSFPQVVAIGVNCTSPEHVPALLGRMRGHTAKPLLAYPNSGERYDATAKHWHVDAERQVTPFAAQVCAWYAAGARLLGGCCRTTPADIGALRGRLAACA